MYIIMKVYLLLVFLISLVYSLHGEFIDTKMENEKQFFIFKSEDNHMHLINLLQPFIEIPVEDSDITFYYYSRDNADSAIVINAAEFDGRLDSKHFKSDRVTYFVTHGYTGTYLFATDLVDALLKAADCNVFVVDWSPISHEFYTTAVHSIPQIGKIIADTINKLVNFYNIPYDRINLQGYSLGTHVMGAVGAHFNGKLNSIVAMDPALPAFNHNELHLRLDQSDAQFVHVIHTNAGFMGFKNPIGHADYYPNGGGMSQPGCGSDLFGSCAHKRSVNFYTESIINSNFKSVYCESYDKFKEGLCDGNPTSYLGGISIDKLAHGTYYLNTASESPFALG